MIVTQEQLAEAAGLAGKDYFTQAEAARYCGVSLSQFRKHAESVGLRPITFMGKLLYRRADCRRAIEEHGNRHAAGPQLGSELVRGRAAVPQKPRDSHPG